MIEALYSKHNRTNFRIYLILCLGAAGVFAYDGYLSQYPWSQRRPFFEAHSKTILFRAAELQKDLDGGLIPPELRLGFTEAKSPLSEAAAISIEEAGRRWVIADQARQYALMKEADGLGVYKVGPDETMLFNRIAPMFFVAGAVILTAWFWLRKDTKLVADENELIVAGKERIPYDAIDRIDKTYFEKKGFFTIIYKKADGCEVHRKLNERDYDNLTSILDHLIAKIT